jgi:hypothetical protein
MEAGIIPAAIPIVIQIPTAIKRIFSEIKTGKLKAFVRAKVSMNTRSILSTSQKADKGSFKKEFY